MSWKNRAKTISPEETQASWKDRATSVAPDVSMTESGLRGLAQGASFGFADELTGLLESALSDKSYEQARDESRANYKSAEEANPKTYLGGQIGGAVGTALIPGLQGAGIGKLAVMGAAQGFGSSEADLTKGDLAGAAKDTAIGAGIGAVTGGIAKGLGKLAPSADDAANAIINTAEDVSRPAMAGTGGYDTIAGKVLGGSRKGAQVLNAIGDIPEATGQALRETGKAAAKGDLSGALSGAIKSGLGGGKLGDVFEAVGSAGAPKTTEQVAKTGGQKALDYALGAAATGKVSGGLVPGIAAGSKVLGKGLDVANKAAFNAANNLSIETVESLAPKLGKYGQVLTSAAARGADSLASTNFILQQTDPEYSKKFLEATGAISEGEEEQ